MLSEANYNAKQNETDGKALKIVTPKQMIQRLPIALAQVKAGNNSEDSLNEIRQSKQITKKSLQKLNEIIIKMDTIFMNSENSKTSKPHILKLKLTDKLDLRLNKKVIALSNLSIYHTWNNIGSHLNRITFKIKDEYSLEL